MKIIADSAIPLLRGVLEPWAEVHYTPGTEISGSDVHNADALIIRTRTHCDEQLLEGSSVRLIATATIGFDHIDTAWCAAHNIRTVTAAGSNARGVLQWFAAVAAHLARTQGWSPRQRTLGIVGVGHVGSLIKEYAESWGFRVLCCDPPRQASERCGFLPIEELAQQADILTFHTPLDATTHHLGSEELLTLMKSDAVVINSSRGAVVDNAALLRSGLNYVLDVWEQEPTPTPALVAKALLATPHIAGYSLQGKANATAAVVEALAREFRMPLKDWYPPTVAAQTPQQISWQELCNTITGAYDIEAESQRLKNAPGNFECIRDNYTYRNEYF